MDRELTYSRRPNLFSGTLGGPLFLLALLSLPTPGAAQELVERIVDFAESASGFEFLELPYEGRIEAGGKATVAVPFLSGADYMVVGFCDQGCTNLDLALLDPQGRELLADRLPDAEPILTYTAESTGRFTVQVEVPGCLTGACHVMVGVLASSSEPGVDPGEDMVGRLVILGGELEASGYIEAQGHWRGALPTEQINSIPLTLEEGIEYRIAGVCDKDCFDLDLALSDSMGRHLTGDRLPDEFPILSYAPETSGNYRLEVFMAACAVDPCAYRIAAYEKAKDAPAPAIHVDSLGHQVSYEGTLALGDEVDPSGAFMDEYRFEVQAGQRIIADLRSLEFDTFLILSAPDGEEEVNDDWQRDIVRSRIEMEAEIEGIYTVRVTSYDPKETGSYSLQITIEDSAPIDRLMRH